MSWASSTRTLSSSLSRDSAPGGNVSFDRRVMRLLVCLRVSARLAREAVRCAVEVIAFFVFGDVLCCCERAHVKSPSEDVIKCRVSRGSC